MCELLETWERRAHPSDCPDARSTWGGGNLPRDRHYSKHPAASVLSAEALHPGDKTRACCELKPVGEDSRRTSGFVRPARELTTL